jgi:hypothetical protein
MAALVERMLVLNEKLAAAAIPADKTLYERQIEGTDRESDGLVHELCGLTEEDIGIVAGREVITLATCHQWAVPQFVGRGRYHNVQGS